MDWQLDAAEVRVLGSLLEKEIATPEYYPLSLNALVNACNQKSNREPVVSYDDVTVENALANLRAKSLAVRITGESRVAKHGQRFTESLNLGRREAAVMCVLMLRGPQTVGELRGRSERLYRFDDLDAVEATLHRLSQMELVTQLERLPGTKEPRFAHLLSGKVESFSAPVHETEAAVHDSSDRDRIAALEADLAALRREFQEFRNRFE
jgi:uncharacterized protein YceH (UPF0502 family)